MFRFRGGVSDVPGVLIILYWVILDFVFIFMPMSNVAHIAHLGGFLGGVITGLILLKVVPIEKEPEFRRVRSYRPDQQPVFTRNDGPDWDRGYEKPKPRLREPGAPTRRRGRAPRPPDELA